MKLSLIVRGQHPTGDTVGRLNDDLDLVRCADRLGFDGIVKGSHYSAHPFESVQGMCDRCSIPAREPRRGDNDSRRRHGVGGLARGGDDGIISITSRQNWWVATKDERKRQWQRTTRQ